MSLYIILLLCVCKSVAQVDVTNMKFNCYDIEDGLSNSKVLSVFQDSIGYLWVGTHDGVSRFDGYQFKSYFHNKLDSTSIVGSVVRVIKEDYDKLLWLGTSDGISCYNRKFDNFISYSYRTNIAGQNYIWDIEQTPDSMLWLATMKGIMLFDPHKRKFKLFKDLLIRDNYQISDNMVFDLFYDDEKKNLLAATSKGLYSIKRAQNYIIEPIKTIHKNIFSIAKASNGDYYLGTRNGLTILKQGKAQMYFANFDKTDSLGHPEIHSILIDNNQNKWLGTYGNLDFFDEKNNRFYHYDYSLNDKFSLKNGLIECIYQDKSNNIWIGTWNGGLYKYAPNLQFFKKNLKLEVPVFHIEAYNESKIVLASLHKFWTYDLTNQTLNELKILNDKNIHVENIQKQNNNLYIDAKKQLLCFNIKNETYEEKKFYINKKMLNPDKILLSESFVFALKNDTMRYFNYDSLTYVDFITDVQTAFPMTIFENMTANIIWLASRGGGLFKYDIKTKQLKKYLPTPDNRHSICDNIIVSGLIDSERNTWFATKNGLSKYNPEQDNFTNITIEQGLPSNYIFEIIEYKNNLWLLTSRGIARLNKQTNNIKAYAQSEGVPTTKYFGSSYFKHRNEIFFSSLDGVMSFFPDSIVRNNMVPTPNFVRLSVFGKEIKPQTEILKTTIETADTIFLDYSHYFFSIEFSAFDYTIANRNQFMYKLQGYDKGWTKTLGKNNKVAYSNIPPGTYAFHLKAANNDDLWSPEARILTVIIAPPYWETVWFKLLIAIFIMGVLTLTYFLGHKRIIEPKKHKIISDSQYEELKEKLTQKEEQLIAQLEKIESQSNQITILQKRENEKKKMQINFFTNIAHEFKTPINVLAQNVKKIIKNQGNNENLKKLQILELKIKELQDLTEQLAVFKKLEAGKAGLNLQHCDVVKTITERSVKFEELSKQKNIEFLIEQSQQSFLGEIDIEKTQMIVDNLLSNAVMFTPENGKIKLTINVNSKEKQLEIKVKDTGIGITKNNYSKIFELFYQENPTSNRGGKGIGLALTKQLVEVMDGSIEIDSTPKKGSLFTIKIPFLDKKVIEQELKQTSGAKNIEEKLEKTQEDRILIVDNNLDNRNLIIYELIEFYNIIEAKNSNEGLKFAFDKMPDLIIYNDNLPLMSSFEFCKQIKTNQNTSHIPILLLTAKDIKYHKTTGYEIVDDYLPIPFGVNLLKACVQNLLEVRKSLQQKYITNTVSYIADKVQNEEPVNDQFLEEVIGLINKNMNDSEFNVEELSAELGMSSAHLYRKIKAMLDINTNELIRNTRLKAATELLISTNKNISEICYQVGFSTPKYFSKCFKQLYDKTPSEYRFFFKKQKK